MPLDKNGDIQLPSDIKSDVTYTIGLTPKDVPVDPMPNPTPTPDPTPNIPTAPTDTIITNVIVHYQDESGNSLAPDKTITGKLGGSWNAVPAEIKGYHLVATKGMATGTISDVRQEVTFVYAKDQALKPTKPNKPANKPAKPSKKPSKSNKPNKQPKPAVIDHGTVYLPSANKTTSSNSKISISRPTIVKAAYADSTAKGINKTNVNSNLPQTGTNVQGNSSTLIAGLTALLISVLSYLGTAFKKKRKLILNYF